MPVENSAGPDTRSIRQRHIHVDSMPESAAPKHLGRTLTSPQTAVIGER
jgi:hypothetical protein